VAAVVREVVEARPGASTGESGGIDGDSGGVADPDDAADSGAALPPLPTGDMAVVGATKIPMTEFLAIYELKIAKYAERGRAVPQSADRRYRRSISERLVLALLLAQEMKRLGLSHDPAALATRREAQRKGIADWSKHLQRRGETDASLEPLLLAELREDAILEHEGKLAVSASEIAADYDRIKDNWRSAKPRRRASHILVTIDPSAGATTGTPPTAKDEAKAKARADELYREATAPGADFAALARAHSSGPSASKGGDIGIFTHDRMAEPFSDEAFKMKVGAVSKPVKTKFGFHIIKLTGSWPPGVLPQSALQDQIVDRLRQRKLHQGRRALRERLTAAATIDNHVVSGLPE
jgi:parvulin-like peptidyl-prolyl isomerase